MDGNEFYVALRSLDYETVERVIREGRDVNENQPLVTVVIQHPQNGVERNNQMKIIKLLVQKGADLEQEYVVMETKSTFLMYTARCRDRNLMKLLLDLGANPNHVVLGCSVLEYVLSAKPHRVPEHDVDTAELLLMYGADPRHVRYGKYIRETGYTVELDFLIPHHLRNLIARYKKLVQTGAMGEINNLTGPDPQKTFIHRAIQRAMALDNEQRFVNLTPEVDQENIKSIFEEAKLLQWSPRTHYQFLPSFQRRVFTSMLQTQRSIDYTQLPPELYESVYRLSSEPQNVNVSTLPSFMNRPAIVF